MYNNNLGRIRENGIKTNKKKVKIGKETFEWIFHWKSIVSSTFYYSSGWKYAEGLVGRRENGLCRWFNDTVLQGKFLLIPLVVKIRFKNNSLL